MRGKLYIRVQSRHTDTQREARKEMSLSSMCIDYNLAAVTTIEVWEMYEVVEFSAACVEPTHLIDVLWVTNLANGHAKVGSERHCAKNPDEHMQMWLSVVML